MSEDKKVKEKNDGVTLESVNSKVNAQGRIIDKIKSWLENMHGADIDGDGQVGRASVLGLALLFVVVAGIFVAIAAEEIFVKYPAPEGADAVIQLSSDEGDDTNDELQLGIKASDNSFFISIGGTERLNLSAAGALTVSSTTAGSTNYTGGVTADTEITLTDTDGSATITASAASGAFDAILVLDASAGEDNADTWSIKSEATGNDLSFVNHLTEVLNLTSAGALQVDSTITAGGSVGVTGGITATDAITLTDASGAASISAIGLTGDYDATLTLDADGGDDTTDTWIIESEGADNDLSFVNHTTEMLKIGKTGDATLTGDLTITGDGLNAAGDLLITPAGGQVHINGGLDVGGTSAVADNSIAVGGTAAIVGVATFTAESVHNLGIDADYITVDEDGAGIDTKAAGTLAVGALTADKIEIGLTTIETEIQGTLQVVEAAQFDAVATFTGQPVLNGGVDINEDIDIDLDASDEEISIVNSAVAGPGDKGLIQISDARIGATATETDEATITIASLGVYALAVSDGAVAVESILDTYAAGALLLGSAEATSVEIADAGVTTDIQGKLTVLGTTTAGIDTAGATAMYIAEETATSLLLGATDCPTTVSGAFLHTAVAVTDTNAYTVLAANSGRTHIMPDLTDNSVFTMPAEAVGLYYKFVYAGGVADGHDWSIDTGANANYFVGGLVKHDVDDGGDDTATVYSDGNSNSKIAILTPAAGTVVEMWCVDGTTWYVSGTVISTTDASVVFADQ